MPASLYESYHHINTAHNSMDRIATDLENDNRAVKLAYELAMLGLDTTGMEGGGNSNSLHHHTLAHLEELKNRKSQNMTECVPVPSSEHVAEIVGRQGE
jgi:RNA-binding protein MEX3